MKKILLIILVILFVSYLSNVKSKELNNNIVIPKEAIRLRILANSNKEEDQKVKMKLSIELEKEISELLKDTTNVEEARIIIKNNIELLDKKINEILKQQNYNITYKLTFGNAFFPEKEYKGVIYEKGYYETLLVTLGNGEGNNWWCVLFPPLCLMEAEESNTEKVEYKFFVQELLNKYL